jgi:kinesin family member 11
MLCRERERATAWCITCVWSHDFRVLNKFNWRLHPIPSTLDSMATRSKYRASQQPPLPSSSSMPPPNSRPRSTLTKSNASQRSGLTASLDEARESQARLNKQLHDSETNIQVVIRCRRRSEREIQEASPIIVQIDGAKSHDITIEAAAPISSFGVVTLPPTRKYPFDLVFGPEADQSLVYQGVVSPMLDEVLQGYNCTLFAYGQTGTGKTYVFFRRTSLQMTMSYLDIQCKAISLPL